MCLEAVNRCGKQGIMCCVSFCLCSMFSDLEGRSPLLHTTPCEVELSLQENLRKSRLRVKIHVKNNLAHKWQRQYLNTSVPDLKADALFPLFMMPLCLKC